jgi:TOBE domain
MMRRRAHHAFLPLVGLGACLWVTTMVGCANRAAPSQPTAPRAMIESVEGASTTYHTRDWNGKPVTVQVPSQAATDIRGTDAEGTVRATITAVETATNRVRVRTSEGQTIVLSMAPGALAGLKPGDPIIFTVPEAPRP